MTKTATVHAQQMWEYQELTRKSAEYMAKELNNLGHQGWELVTMLQGKDRKNETAWIAFIKRPYVPHGSPTPADAGPSGSAVGSHADTPTAASPPATAAAYAIGDDEDFELEEPEVEAPAPAAKPAAPAAEGEGHAPKATGKK
jgi:hypothetical protein